jgi:hypothetical protein
MDGGGEEGSGIGWGGMRCDGCDAMDAMNDDESELPCTVHRQ